MISFSRDGNLFRVKLEGDRTVIRAKDLAEMKLALDHYYVGHRQDEPMCPLCAASAVWVIKHMKNRKEKA